MVLVCKYAIYVQFCSVVFGCVLVLLSAWKTSRSIMWMRYDFPNRLSNFNCFHCFHCVCDECTLVFLSVFAIIHNLFSTEYKECAAFLPVRMFFTLFRFILSLTCYVLPLDWLRCVPLHGITPNECFVSFALILYMCKSSCFSFSVIPCCWKFFLLNLIYKQNYNWRVAPKDRLVYWNVAPYDIN